MTEQASLHHDALGMLDAAGQLAARAVRMALRALPEGDDARWTDDQALDRAAKLATVATASARVAHGLVAVEHVGMLRDYEEKVETRYDGFLDVARTMADEDGRDPYDPPTLTGPFEVTDDHWFIKEPVLRDELPVPTLGRVRFFKPGLYEVDISQTGIDRIELVSEGDPRPAAAEWRREPDGS